MKKFLDFILVRRPETENKWWHRLFVILLFGSGVIVLILTLYLSVVSYNHKWVTYHPESFSLELNKPLVYTLEPNYQLNNGNDLLCEENPVAFNNNETSILDWAGVKCDGVVLSEFDSKRYAKLYLSAYKKLGTQYGFDKYYDCPQSTDGKLCGFDIISKGMKAEETDPSYGQYQNDLKNLAHIKVAGDINYGFIFRDIAIWLIIPIIVFALWVVFWSPIIYRSILYVIFGKKK